MCCTKKYLTSVLVVLCLGLYVLLTACGSGATSNTQLQPAAAPTLTSNIQANETPAPPPTTTPNEPKATITKGPDTTLPPTPYITPLPQERQPEVTSAAQTGQTSASGCVFSASYISPTLAEQVMKSLDIVQVQVSSIGEKIWNTPDGKAPADVCTTQYYQYSPIEITIKESFKGHLTLGSKLTIWRSGAPGSTKQGNYDYFPKNGETLILFLGEEENLRQDTPSNPLTTRIVWDLYRMESPGSDKWVSQITETPFTLEWLKAVVKDPAIEPTRTPFPPPPTAYAREGQTFQPSNYYSLDKAIQLYIKAINGKVPQNPSEKPGSDRFTRLVKAFNQPLQVLQSPANYPNSENGVIFGFELANHTYASFVYYPDTNTLIHELKDGYNLVELKAPDDLKTIFGL